MKKRNANIPASATLRTSAEAQLAGVAKAEIPSTPNDKILHELQVHQIELEMQNEELMRAQQALEESRNRYLQLYDFAPVAYLTLTEQGFIAEANPAGSTLFGVERNKLINSRFAHYVDPEDRECWQQCYLTACLHGEKQGCELTLRRADGCLFQANLDWRRIRSKDKSVKFHVTITDISERKQAEWRLRIAATAFDMQTGVMVTDANRVILRVNQAFSRITGYSAEAAVGQKPSILRSGLHDKDFYQALWAAVAQDGFWQGEIWDKHQNGDVLPFWLIITAVADENGLTTHLVGSFIDIPAQKQSEKWLLDRHQRMENQVGITTGELGKVREETAVVKNALKVLLKHQKEELSDAQRLLSIELRETVLPFVEKLKQSGLVGTQASLLQIIEAGLLQVRTGYGHITNLPAACQQLTPVEIQVASLVRQGLSSKAIATALALSPETINVHRKHIRKKLGLESKASSLRGYLLLLPD